MAEEEAAESEAKKKAALAAEGVHPAPLLKHPTLSGEELERCDK